MEVLGVAAAYAIVWGIEEFPAPSRVEWGMGLYVVLAITSVLWVSNVGMFLVAVRVAAYQFLAFFFFLSDN